MQLNSLLTHSLTLLLMPSDKRNLIMAIATALISSLFNVALSAPTTAAPMLASWFYQSSPLFSFVLHSFSLTAQVTIYSTRIMASVRDLGNAVQAGVLLTLFSAQNGSQKFKELEGKRNVMIHSVKATHPLLYQ